MGLPFGDRDLVLRRQRGRELIENILDGFTGWLMSDGWIAYRHYPHRLRCWAHLIRKARGLAQICNWEAHRFGWQALKTLAVLMAAAYAAREGPPTGDLSAQHTSALAELCTACAQHQNSNHAQTHALAVELLRLGGYLLGIATHGLAADQQ